MLGVDALYEFAKKTKLIPEGSTMQTALADREAENRFLSKHPSWSPMEVAGWRGRGRPGLDEEMSGQLKALGASDNEIQRYLDLYRQRNPIPLANNKGFIRKSQGFIADLLGKQLPGERMFTPTRYSGGMPMDNPANYRTIPNITVMINGVQVDPGSVEAQIANAFGNLYKPL